MGRQGIYGMCRAVWLWAGGRVSAGARLASRSSVQASARRRVVRAAVLNPTVSAAAAQPRLSALLFCARLSWVRARAWPGQHFRQHGLLLSYSCRTLVVLLSFSLRFDLSAALSARRMRLDVRPPKLNAKIVAECSRTVTDRRALRCTGGRTSWAKQGTRGHAALPR
jgi:hypothetical protein